MLVGLLPIKLTVSPHFDTLLSGSQRVGHDFTFHFSLSLSLRAQYPCGSSGISYYGRFVYLPAFVYLLIHISMDSYILAYILR